MIQPEQIAVEGGEIKKRRDFPRPSNWTPRTALLMKTRAGRQDSLHILDCCHRAGDASTADVYRAVLRSPANSELSGSLDAQKPVVVKVRRGKSAISLDPVRIEDRFLSEVRTIQQLSQRDEFREVLSPLWNLDGSTFRADTALAIGHELFFCTAANHALKLEKSRTKSIDLKSVPFLRDERACAGCHIYQEYAGRPDEWKAKCRPWLVSANPNPQYSADYCLPATEALIYSDVGVTLQHELRQQQTEFSYESLVRQHSGLLDLARRMSMVHRAGWLHLDLNLDNICIDALGNVRPIDFGQGEPIDPQLQNAQVFDERIHYRISDFVAPEMQQRKFDIYFQINEVRSNSLIVSFTELAGWPLDWFPAPGDRLKLTPLAHRDLTVWMTITEKMPGRFSRKLTIDRPQDVAHFEVGQQIEATVNRISTAAADIYAFGLVVLCWIFGITKPVLLRDELSVAKRILKKIRNRQDCRDVDISNSLAFWLDYREGLGYHSTVLDEFCEPVISQRLSIGSEPKQTVYLFMALMRLGVQCVLRQNPVQLDSPELSFDSVVQRLEEIENTLQRHLEIADDEVKLPMSLQGYMREINETRMLVRSKLLRNTTNSAQVKAQLASIGQSLESATVARALQQNARREIQDLAQKIKQAAADYFHTYQKLSWVTRGVTIPCLNLFGKSASLPLNIDSTNAGMAGQAQNAVEDFLAEAWVTPQQRSRVAEVNSLLMRAGTLLPQIDILKKENRFEAKIRNQVQSISDLADLLEAFDLGDALNRTSTRGEEMHSLIRDSQAMVTDLRSECRQSLSEIERREPQVRKLEQRIKRLNAADRDIAKFLHEALKDDFQDAKHRLQQQFNELQLVGNILLNIDKSWSDSPDECLMEISNRLSIWTSS